MSAARALLSIVALLVCAVAGRADFLSDSLVDELRKVVSAELPKDANEGTTDQLVAPEAQHIQASAFHLMSGTSTWGYVDEDGLILPANWSSVSATCGSGARQSPIDITDAVADDTLEFLTFEHHGDISGLAVINNGHSFKVDYSSVAQELLLSGGPLAHNYILHDIHFHWGLNDDAGSEHAVDGHHYPLEMHMVHYNSRYDSLTEALGEPDGLAVVAVFFKVGHYNREIEKLVSVLPTIVNGSTQTTLTEPFDVIRSIPALRISATSHETTDFYTYEGSLTTPSCNEVVTWLVCKDEQWLSEDQMETIRRLRRNDERRIYVNYRPKQAINGRTIRSSVASGFDVPTTSDAARLVFTLMLHVLVPIVSVLAVLTA